ncbi:globin family protein, partial [Acidithiobacillus concretivorus]
STCCRQYVAFSSFVIPTPSRCMRGRIGQVRKFGKVGCLDAYEQINLVQSSFSKVKPISDQAAELFYARLFEIAPQVKPMFKGDMVEQGRKLMAMIHTVVNGLKNLDDIVPAAQNLARSHVDYGVQSEHYTYVGEALIYALEQGLAEDFTQPVKQAWIEAYTLLSDVMIAAAEQFEMANKKPLWKRLLKG